MNDWSDAEGHVEKAHEHFEHGRWADAESELRQALALNPYKPEWHFNLGLTLEAAGRFGDAIEAFRDCHMLDQDDTQVMVLLGVNSLRTGNPADGAVWLEKASKVDPQCLEAFVHRIEAFSRLGDHEQAEVMFYLAEQIEAHHPMALANLAQSLLSRGLNEKAVWCLREAAHRDPDLPGIHAQLAHAYAATGRRERARQLFLRELRGDPGNVLVLLDLGSLLTEMNRLTEAGEKFRRVLEIQPDNADAHFHLADLAERQGQFETATEQFGVVQRLNPGFPNARRRLAALLLRRSRSQDGDVARELLREEMAAFSEAAMNGEVGWTAAYLDDDLFGLGRTLLDAGLADECRQVLMALCTRRPAWVAALHTLSVACFQLNQRAAGRRYARRAVRVDDKFTPAMHNLAVSCFQDGRWSLARVWARRALAVDPDDVGVRRLVFKARVAAVAVVVRRVIWGRSIRDQVQSKTRVPDARS